MTSKLSQRARSTNRTPIGVAIMLPSMCYMVILSTL
jgi:hypothetical protein